MKFCVAIQCANKIFLLDFCKSKIFMSLTEQDLQKIQQLTKDIVSENNKEMKRYVDEAITANNVKVREMFAEERVETKRIIDESVAGNTGSIFETFANVSKNFATKDDIAELKTDVAGIKTDVALLKVDVITLKEDVATLKQDVAVLKEDVAELKDDMGEVRSDLNTLRIFTENHQRATDQEVILIKNELGMI